MRFEKLINSKFDKGMHICYWTGGENLSGGEIQRIAIADKWSKKEIIRLTHICN